MNVTWIIGNGFDVNLGLKTGYRSFLNDCYLKGADESGYRTHLIRAVDEDPFAKNARYWSDLEALLGVSSQYYTNDEQELFTDTFEDIESQFISYVRGEERRLPDTLPSECIDEFKRSIGEFYYSMPPRERSIFGLQHVRDAIYHRFVCLNYTHSLDSFIAALADDGLIKSRQVGGTTFRDAASAPLHVHGIMGEDQDSVRDIVFGVDSIGQIKNETFAQDELFVERWVKENENTSLYQNLSEDSLTDVVGDADVFCVYGCSLGASDRRIWQMVARRMANQSHVLLVLFVYGYPDRHALHARAFQRARGEWMDTFRKAADMSADDYAAIRDRVHILPSKDLFRMDGKIELDDS